MLKEKYAAVLKRGEELQIKDGYVREEDNKLKIGGTAPFQHEKDQLWDEIKQHSGWEAEIEADIQVADTTIYGLYTVQSGDTLSKLSKSYFGDARRYMEIFEANRDQLDNPNLIKVGQKLKLPTR